LCELVGIGLSLPRRKFMAFPRRKSRKLPPRKCQKAEVYGNFLAEVYETSSAESCCCKYFEMLLPDDSFCNGPIHVVSWESPGDGTFVSL